MIGNAPRGPGKQVIPLSKRKTGGRVLVADDALFIRVLLRAILTEHGHTVVGEASTGREAVSMFSLFRPDVVLMDITMPGQDGLAAMEEILAASPKAAVIICSALQFKRTAIEAIARGAYDFITKPFRPDAILQTVERAMLQKRRRSSSAARSSAH